MPPEHSQITPWAIAALVAFVLYRRLRRQFGQQPVNPMRMGVRLAVLLLLGALLSPLALVSAQLALIMSGALLLGVALGAWSGAHTRFERAQGQLHYVPHSYAGIAITALVIGRVAYRFAHGPAAGPPGIASAVSPPTLGLLFALVGYYLSYYGGILWKARQLGINKELTPEPPASP